MTYHFNLFTLNPYKLLMIVDMDHNTEKVLGFAKNPFNVHAGYI